MSLPLPWELALAWALRAAVVLAAVIHAATGDVVYGAFSLIAVGIAIVPATIARNSRAVWPVEVELVYLWLLVSDVVLGNLAGLYFKVPWYDKALHLSSAVLVGVVAFYAVYLAHSLGRIQRHPWIDGAAIFLVTLGLGALWEIGEFGVDQAFGRRTQGSPVQGAIDDTMWDLILDGAGGVIGAILGPLYMTRSGRSRARLDAIAKLLDDRERRREAPAHLLL